MEDSAQKRPQFSVEEMPPVNPETVAPPVPEVAPQGAEPVSVETIPQFTPPPPPPVPTPNPIVSESQPVVPPAVHQAHKPNALRALFFLIPALLLVATIYFVAKFTGNNYVMREPAPIATATPELVPASPTPLPTAIPVPVKTYINSQMFLQISIPESYEVMSEDGEFVSLGKNDTELLTISTNLDDYDEGNQDHSKVGDFLFVTYAETAEEEAEFSAIVESVIFLVDTSDWETFDNTTYNYMIKYPSEWEITNTENKTGKIGERTEISKDATNKTLNNLVILTQSNLNNAAFTASQIVSSTRTLSGWKGTPKNELKKIGGGDAQVIQGELGGKWHAYVVIWYKNTVVQMTWEDTVARPQQQIFDNILASFEFTN